jgi:ribosomal protein L37AE/L43A
MKKLYKLEQLEALKEGYKKDVWRIGMINILEKLKLLKKCEFCHEEIATRRVIDLSRKEVWICEKCFKIIKF